MDANQRQAEPSQIDELTMNRSNEIDQSKDIPQPLQSQRYVEGAVERNLKMRRKFSKDVADVRIQRKQKPISSYAKEEIKRQKWREELFFVGAPSNVSSSNRVQTRLVSNREEGSEIDKQFGTSTLKRDNSILKNIVIKDSQRDLIFDDEYNKKAQKDHCELASSLH